MAAMTAIGSRSAGAGSATEGDSTDEDAPDDAPDDAADGATDATDATDDATDDAAAGGAPLRADRARGSRSGTSSI